MWYAFRQWSKIYCCIIQTKWIRFFYIKLFRQFSTKLFNQFMNYIKENTYIEIIWAKILIKITIKFRFRSNLNKLMPIETGFFVNRFSNSAESPVMPNWPCFRENREYLTVNFLYSLHNHILSKFLFKVMAETCFGYNHILSKM